MVLAYREHYTLDDWRQWKGDWELVEGMAYAMTPSPGVSHQRTLVRLSHLLESLFEDTEECGACMVLVEIDWEISSDTVVRPDLLVTCHQTGERILKAPALIVEVVSATSSRRDEQLKFELYAREGVPWYLLAYPDLKLVKIYRNRSGAYYKVSDAGEERVSLSLDACRFQLDFGRLWR